MHKNALPIVLDEEDLKKFRTAPLLVSALKNALGGRLGQPTLIGASIEIEVVTDTSEIPYSMESFVEDLQVTAAELKRNANLRIRSPMVRCRHQADFDQSFACIRGRLQ